ncbi:hypothetical protein QWY31_14270 [Cytophagales bacterium LB-30]|uniref:DUF2116 family Zn-ribbon domain-containing protein n=1 Tax=Shiella aurantiaca TaxID=3058365 RepID=A0ABT8F868_9BACT|nr:hypothetical protein [Shiella aurantiaca]MDN4166672.1 hypothetical protein [Shiella aurantiaca]
MDDQNQCPECGEKLVGRADKRFCSDQCRSLFNNKSRKKHELTILSINKILRKNRKILHDLNPIGLTTLRREVLVLQGFNFSFYTHQFRTNQGSVYYFCYEYGYLLMPDEKISIVTWQDYMNRSIKGISF